MSGITIRELSEPTELAAVCVLFDEIWQPAPGHGSEIEPGLLRLWSYTGQYLAGAYTQNALIGASVAFFGDRPRRSLHSHVTAVTPGHAGRGIGTALKRHQRDWAHSRDVGVITWTFDPLVTRNAYFNLNRLGARPVAYLPDFYGERADAVNAGAPSDRLFVHWQVAGPPPGGCADPVPVGPALPLRTVLEADADGEPRRLDPAPGGGPLAVAVPEDIEALRHQHPDRAYRWRLAVRDVLTPLIGAHTRVRFRAGPGYLIDPAGVPAGS